MPDDELAPALDCLLSDHERFQQAWRLESRIEEVFPSLNDEQTICLADNHLEMVIRLLELDDEWRRIGFRISVRPV